MEERVLKNSRNGREKGQKAVQTRKPAAWVDAILPFYIALGPVGTLI